MKLKSIVALLGLSASMAAFAVPFTANTPAPSVIGPAPGGEHSLQTIADDLFGTGHVNVNTGQSSSAFFTFATSSGTSIPTMVAEFTGNESTQSFGIWFGTDTTHIVTYDLLLGPAHAGDNAAISFSGNTLNVGSSVFSACGTRVNCGSLSDPLVNMSSFGFFFRPSGPSSSPTYYTLDQLNPGPRTDRTVAFQDGTSTNWLFAYEDGTDFDYNDMAVKVESITAAVPEPETYALMLAGLGAMGFIARRRKQR
jgi:Domain of unknown function (DUF4114)/PEP-CTERM motif